MIRLLYDNERQRADLVRNGGNIETEDSFETAVIISLFTRRRTEPGDELPEPGSHREGWWADRYPDVEGDQIGSRLWTLGRSKLTQAAVNLAREYAEEALEWLVEDGIAESASVIAERHAEGVLAIQPKIVRSANPASPWVRFWAVHLADL